MLPFPVGGALPAPRPLPPAAPKQEHFSGAMDDALGQPRETRPADDRPRPTRRDEPARPRETSAPKAAAPSRKVSGAPPAALKKNNPPDDADVKDAVERSQDDKPSDDVA